MLTVVVANLYKWTEQAAVILMPRKIYIIMSNSVNSILLRPFIGTVLAIDSVLLERKQFMSWLQSGHYVFSFFLLLAVMVSAKQVRNMHQTLSLCDSIVPIISSLNLLLCDFGMPERLQLFYKQEARGREDPLHLERVLVCSDFDN